MPARSGIYMTALLVGALGAVSPALAQKQGGTLRTYIWDNPPSLSIHEEATISTVWPAMGLFNNLVLFDQAKPTNTMDTIIPDLAKSWSWDAGKTKLTFKLEEGVTWHDGKPFTAKDVQCTWHMLIGKLNAEDFRKNPRSVWYHNLDEVTVNGDHEVTFNLKAPQPSFMALLASGYSPVYACHVSQRDMRTKPIGTGPFKFVEFKRNEMVRVVRNPDYWRKGKPYLDGIDFKIIDNRSTRMLAFIAGEFDLTFHADITVAGLKDIASQAPKSICQLLASNNTINMIVNSSAPPFDNLKVRQAMAMALDRNAFNTILAEGNSMLGAVMLPPPVGAWGMAPEELAKLPGYGTDLEKNQAGARKIMEELGYSQTKPLKVKVATRNIPLYRDPAVILIDQMKKIHIEGELEVVDFDYLARQGPARRLCRRSQYDGRGRGRSRCQSCRELYLQVGSQLHQVLQPRRRQVDLRSIQGSGCGQAQRARVGGRAQDRGGRGEADHLSQSGGHLLVSASQRCRAERKQRL